MSQNTTVQAMDESGEIPRTREEWTTRRLSNAMEAGVSPIIQEQDDALIVRRPIHYNASATPLAEEPHVDTQAIINRARYYDRLTRGTEENMRIPNHMVPPEFYTVLLLKTADGTQNSFTTVFSIWNTMMGTSVLSMPWAVQQAGFVFGILLILAMAGICCYTAYRVLESPKILGVDISNTEFSDVCRYHFGRVGETIAVAFSLVSLLGAAVVYMVLMATFLYDIVVFIESWIHHHTYVHPVLNTTQYTDVVCPHPPPYAPVNASNDYFYGYGAGRWGGVYGDSNSTDTHLSTFDKYWHKQHTVPFVLALLVFPIINLKSPSFFTKFNSFGAITILFMLAFVATKAAKWNFHMDFSSSGMPEFKPTFPALTGILSLALFIHNCVISITRNARNPENRGRDLCIAYLCVTLTYLVFGGIFYAAFPLDKRCIEDNLLNNFASSDVMAFVAKIALFMQLYSVFPLLMYVFRVQVLLQLFGDIYPGLKHVVVTNALVIAVCLVFACFYPNVGRIISFSGAISGLVYIFSMPNLVYMKAQWMSGRLKWYSMACHVTLIVLGAANLVGQFVMLAVKHE